MHETLALVLGYVRAVWRFRWLVLGCATLLSSVGWTSVMLMPNQYEVTAKVYLDSSSMLKPLLRGLAVDSGLEQDAVLMMRRTLLVRPNLEAVARKTDLDLQAQTPEAFEALLSGLATRIKVTGTGRDNIFVIGFEDKDPKTATRVVEAILNLFVERSLGESRKDTSKTKQFLDKQIAEYESRLVAAESRLKAFKQKNVGLMPAEGKGYYGRLQQTQQELADATLQLDEAVRRRDELRRQLAGFDAQFSQKSVVPQLPAHPLDERIVNLEKSLDQLLLQYTDKHPDVVATRRVLEELKTERREDFKARAGDVTGEKVDPRAAENPIFQELHVGLGAAEAEVAGLSARVAEFQRRSEELRGLVDTIPRIEAELVQLNRDYEVNLKNFEELLKRRESLKIAQDASQSTDEVKFNIIEPPREPRIPIGPNRPLLSAGVFAVALGGGLGLAILFALARPAIYTKDAINAITPLPVIGVVSRIWTPRERVQRRVAVATFAVGSMVLFAMFGGLMSLYALNVDIAERVQTLAQRFT